MPRRSLRRAVIEGSGGFSLLELSTAMGGLLLVSAVMMSFFVGATRVEGIHGADDTALEQLRDARQRMSRDIREARRFTSIAPTAFTVWVDDGWDEVIGPTESITWHIDVAGNLWRSLGTASRVEARGLSVTESYFTYDSAFASSVTSMRLHLVAVVAAPGDGAPAGTRSLETEITLRNVP